MKMNTVIIVAVLVIALVWTIYCFWDEIKQFFMSGQRTNSTGPGGGGSHIQAIAHEQRFIADIGGSTENLAECIKGIDEKDLKQLILTRVGAREITHNQYSFFSQITTDHLNLLMTRCGDEKARQKVQERISKLQWISREN
jgi:hypothetical protein